MSHPKPGNIFIITGPSGVGKGTLCHLLLAGDANLQLSVSATSRAMRAGEVDGVNYHFKTRADFEAMIRHDEAETALSSHYLLEWAEYNGNYYGTPRQAVQDSLAQGHDILLEIETQGALQIKNKFPEACLIFIAPPSMEELERRLRSRGTENEVDIENRLRISRHEMSLRPRFDFVVVNDMLETCLKRIQTVIRGRGASGSEPESLC